MFFRPSLLRKRKVAGRWCAFSLFGAFCVLRCAADVYLINAPQWRCDSMSEVTVPIPFPWPTYLEMHTNSSALGQINLLAETGVGGTDGSIGSTYGTVSLKSTISNLPEHSDPFQSVEILALDAAVAMDAFSSTTYNPPWQTLPNWTSSSMDSEAVIEFGVVEKAQFSLSLFATNVFVTPLFLNDQIAASFGTTYARLETLSGMLVTNIPLPTLGTTKSFASIVLEDDDYRFTYHSDVTTPDYGGINSRIALQMKVEPGPLSSLMAIMRNPDGIAEIKVWGYALGVFHLEYSHALGVGGTWQHFESFNATETPYVFTFPVSSIDTSSTVFFRLVRGD
jgi:hypothetical protein